ncbi:MAG: hypothetical protein K2M56_07300 [Muribaculaceae bacterium]|nr:hypothetical protein [Muribaculaceae bacterium]
MSSDFRIGSPGLHRQHSNVDELLMRPQGAYITGVDSPIDGGATASFFYSPLHPEK